MIFNIAKGGGGEGMTLKDLMLELLRHFFRHLCKNTILKIVNSIVKIHEICKQGHQELAKNTRTRMKHSIAGPSADEVRMWKDLLKCL